LLPILYFDRVLHIENRPAAAVAADAVNIAILQAGDRQFGLVVDRVDDAQEIVVKPLWQKLKGIACFAGATIMGDGHVALILDVFGLARQTGMAAKGRDALAAAPTAIAVAPAQPHGILLVEGAEHQRLAIPLEYVDRLEEFPAQAIERMGAQHVVQYRGAILPLLDLCGRFQARGEKAAAGELVRVVVHARAGMRVGLVVARIVDVIEHEVPVEPGRERGRCSSVVQGRITEFLDVPRLLSGTGIPA
jgi:two-component system chemotaxis sensor kinase CheA